jgi:hypothetical protein
VTPTYGKFVSLKEKIMDAGLVWTIVGTVLGAAGLGFGIFESYRARRLKDAIKILSKTYPGDVAKIYQSAYWAWANANKAVDLLGKLPESDSKQEILTIVSNAKADSAAAERMCTIVFNQLLSLQEVQFGTREMTHPDKKGLVLCKNEYESTKNPNNFTC